MRIALVLAALAALCACATVPAPAMPAPATQAAASSGGSRTQHLLAAAGRPDAPTRAEIERVFGQPDLARQDGAGAALTYRLQSCALLLLFEADQRNALRLSEAHASPRRAGEAAPSLEQCANEATSH